MYELNMKIHTIFHVMYVFINQIRLTRTVFTNKMRHRIARFKIDLFFICVIHKYDIMMITVLYI